jgi:hypothetical protein
MGTAFQREKRRASATLAAGASIAAPGRIKRMIPIAAGEHSDESQPKTLHLPFRYQHAAC